MDKDVKESAEIDLDADPNYGFAADQFDDVVAEPQTGTGAAVQTAELSPLPVPARQRGWLERLNPFQEQHFARRVAREILDVRRQIEQARPGLADMEMLRLVVMLRCKVDPYGAHKLIREAEESFASWPTPRELSFGDVVHLIAIKEFRAEFGKAKWINANMGQIIATELLRMRKQ
jgi:hypothetical protein